MKPSQFFIICGILWLIVQLQSGCTYGMSLCACFMSVISSVTGLVFVFVERGEGDHTDEEDTNS